MDRAPWPGAEPEYQLAVLAADVARQQPPGGDANGTCPTVSASRRARRRRTSRASRTSWRLSSTGLGFDRAGVARPHAHTCSATRVSTRCWPNTTGGPVARRRGLDRTSGSAMLRTGTVLPEFRGHGLQRALICERIRLAMADGCDLVTAMTGVDEHLRRQPARHAACAASARAPCTRSIRRPTRRPELSEQVDCGQVSDRLSLERSGPGNVVARVTLNRPDVHNAFNASLIDELRRAFAALAREEPADTLRAVVLAGDGPSFCAGADINWMRARSALDREQNEQDAMVMAEMFDAIDRCPAPVIARVQGAALGGGMGLCAVSDLVDRRSGRQVRLHRDAPGHPARGHLAVRDRQDRRDATRGPSSPAGADSTPRARCASAWSTRSSRATRRLTRPSPRRSRTCSRPARPPRAPPRPSSARSADCRTSRRAGTPRDASPRSARAPKARKACARSSNAAIPHGRSNQMASKRKD